MGAQGLRNILKSRGANFLILTNLSVILREVPKIDGCNLGLYEKSRGAIVHLAPL